VDFQKNLHGAEINFFLISEPRKKPEKKRKRYRLPVDSSSEESSSDSGDSDPDSNREEEEVRRDRAPKRSKDLWSADEIQNLRKNYRFLETIQDSILARTPLKDIVKMGGGQKQGERDFD
jgi:hypothetical protein